MKSTESNLQMAIEMGYVTCIKGSDGLNEYQLTVKGAAQWSKESNEQKEQKPYAAKKKPDRGRFTDTEI